MISPFQPMIMMIGTSGDAAFPIFLYTRKRKARISPKPRRVICVFPFSMSSIRVVNSSSLPVGSATIPAGGFSQAMSCRTFVIRSLACSISMSVRENWTTASMLPARYFLLVSSGIRSRTARTSASVCGITPLLYRRISVMMLVAPVIWAFSSTS